MKQLFEANYAEKDAESSKNRVSRLLNALPIICLPASFFNPPTKGQFYYSQSRLFYLHNIAIAEICSYVSIYTTGRRVSVVVSRKSSKFLNKPLDSRWRKNSLQIISLRGAFVNDVAHYNFNQNYENSVLSRFVP